MSARRPKRVYPYERRLRRERRRLAAIAHELLSQPNQKRPPLGTPPWFANFDYRVGDTAKNRLDLAYVCIVAGRSSSSGGFPKSTPLDLGTDVVREPSGLTWQSQLAQMRGHLSGYQPGDASVDFTGKWCWEDRTIKTSGRTDGGR